MRDVCLTDWFGFWSIWFAVGVRSPNHANHGKPITKVWTALPPYVGWVRIYQNCRWHVLGSTVRDSGW